MRNRLFLVIGVGILLVPVLGIGGALIYLSTPSGATTVVRSALSRFARFDDLSLQGIEVSFSGISLKDIQIQGLDRLPSGSILEAGRVHVDSLLPRDLKKVPVEVQDGKLTLRPSGDAASVGRVRGSLTGGFSLYDLEMSAFGILPTGSVVKIGRIDTYFPPRPENVTAVDQGSMKCPGFDPIVFSGSQLEGRLDLRLGTKSLDLKELVQFLPSSEEWKGVRGTLTDLEIGVKDSWKQPRLIGRFQIKELSRGSNSLSRCPGFFTMNLKDVRSGLKVYGEVVFKSGSVVTSRVPIELHESTLKFSGDPTRPSFDFKGTARMEGTVIQIVLKGTMEDPQLDLSSSPPIPQRGLLFMLATGKSWDSVQTLLAQAQMAPPELIQAIVTQGGQLSPEVAAAVQGKGTVSREKIEALIQKQQITPELKATVQSQRRLAQEILDSMVNQGKLSPAALEAARSKGQMPPGVIRAVSDYLKGSSPPSVSPLPPPLPAVSASSNQVPSSPLKAGTVQAQDQRLTIWAELIQGQGPLPAGLSKDFIHYLIFGDSGPEIMKLLGTSGVPRKEDSLASVH